MTYLVVALCTTLSGCTTYEHPLPDVTLLQCEHMAPAILAQIELPEDALLLVWKCQTGEPA
jgi:hypothetical protein